MGLRRIINDWIRDFLESRNIALVNSNASQLRQDWVKSIRKIRDDSSLLLIATEATQLICAIKATENIEGNIAEVGVVFGGSAKLICEYSKNTEIHLFDTFEGLPAPTDKDTGSMQILTGGEFACSLDSVRSFVNDPRCNFYKGLFPETANALLDTTFSFVHLDVYLYGSTLAGLDFFYPRMALGRIIISHDFSILSGGPLAFGDFFCW